MMTLLLNIPSRETIETFERAMMALGSHPDQDPQDRGYGHLPPLRKFVLNRQSASDADLSGASPVGWQYLIQDSLGFAVVDISDKFRKTFSSVRRGPFAHKYESVLREIDADRGPSPEEFGAEILEIPQLGTCAMLVRGSAGLFIYPVILSGELTQIRVLALDDFFNMIARPVAPRQPKI